MKNNKKIIFYVVSAVLSVALSLGVISNDTYAVALENAVTISVYDYEGNEVMEQTPIEIEDGDTAYDVLEEATESKGLELYAPDSDWGKDLKVIGDTEVTGTYFWSFLVNGQQASLGSSSYKVENADNLRFQLDNWGDGMALPMHTITVSANDGNNVIIPETQVSVVVGSTAYDALVQAAEQVGVSIDASVDDTHFTGVNNIAETELGDTEYFEFRLNGEFATNGAGSQIVNDGDSVTFNVVEWENPSTPEGPQEEAPVEETPTEQVPEEQTNTAFANTALIAEEGRALYNYIVNNHTPLEYGDEWAVFGLAHSEYNDFEPYVTSVAETVQANNGVLKSLETQKIVITLSLLGYDARDFAGYDLVDSMLENNNKNQNANTAIYTLLALDSGEYEVEERVRESLIQTLLDKELSVGGWAFFGSTPSVDITGMALNALAPYRDDPEVQVAIDRALTYLSENQHDNGGYYEQFNGGYSSESVSQLITGLTAVGVDPTSAEFTKAEGNLFDYLLSFKNEDGGYSHTLDSSTNTMATIQAYLAFVAYELYENGQGSVYTETIPEAVVVPEEETTTEEISSDEVSSEEETTTSEGATSEETETTSEVTNEEENASETEEDLPETGVGTSGIIVAVTVVLSGSTLLALAGKKDEN